MKDTDFHKFVSASQTLSQVPLFIDDTAALTISAIRTRARRLKRQHKLGMLVIDYLHCCKAPPAAAGRKTACRKFPRSRAG